MVRMNIYCVSYIDTQGEDFCIEVCAYTRSQAEFLATEELPGCTILSVERTAYAIGG